jgi:hypothetical protein
MVVQRLPIVNSDDGVWGDIIRQYIMKEHFNDDTDNPVNGGHQKVTIRAGTATAGTAPLKFTTGTLMTTPEVGATEFAGDNLYFTITSGTVRKKIALYDDTSGATGDIYYRDGTGYFTRLPIGATNKTLRVSGGLPAWADADTNPAVATSTKTSSYTITGTDVIIFADATSTNVTITLPTAASFTGYNFYVKRIDGSANTCSVARSGSDTIDGATSFSLDTQYFSIRAVSNGTNWYII